MVYDMNITDKYIDARIRNLSSVGWECNGIFFRMYPFKKASLESYDYYVLKFKDSFKWFKI